MQSHFKCLDWLTESLLKTGQHHAKGFFTGIFVFQIEVLPEIVEAVQGTGVEVYLDGGVR